MNRSSDRSSSSGNDVQRPPADREIPGKWVVLTIVAGAMAATAVLWIYFTLHLAPFRPLQEKIAAEFLRSRPRVEGGQRKMHKGTPRILRITMKVDFDPGSDPKTAEAFVDRVVNFVRVETDLSQFDEVELHLYMLESEHEIRQKSFTRPVEEILGKSADDK